MNRKISHLGLQIAYRVNASFCSFIRQTVALVLVRNVRFSWQEIKATAPNLHRVDEFITYFEETWLVGNFSLGLWNVYEINSNSPRTNNHIEGWHNNLKLIAKKSHPNVYELIEIFKHEHANTEVSIAQLAIGSQTSKRDKKYIEKDNKIETLENRLRQDTITLREYVRAISAHV